MSNVTSIMSIAANSLNTLPGWDISTASYVQSFSVSGQDLNPYGLSFSPNGVYMYITGRSGDDVNQFDLGTAWDISSAVYTRRLAIGAQTTTNSGLFISDDGAHMYITSTTGVVYEYLMSGTPFLINGASYVRSLVVSSQESLPSGVFFKPDGTKMYIVGYSGDEVNEYNLSTAWNISTASHVQFFSIAAQEATPFGLFFRSDGLKMYISGTTVGSVYEYDLGTAWDISTASFVQSFSTASQDTYPTGLYFNPEGGSMYVLGINSRSIHEYSIS